jgi:enoyl-CoA hydratase/carnithine racemase
MSRSRKCTAGDGSRRQQPSPSLGVGPTGLPAWIDVLVRLARAPVVSIASIPGRARGAGSEFVLACDLRFASRENTLLGQFEVGVGAVPGAVRWPGSPALPAAAARSRSCSSPTISTDRALSNMVRQRLIADDQLDDEVEAIASRLARFHHDAIARTKSYVDLVTLPSDSELPCAIADFRELFARPAQQEQWARLEALGLNTDSELERQLGKRVVEAIDDA